MEWPESQHHSHVMLDADTQNINMGGTSGLKQAAWQIENDGTHRIHSRKWCYGVHEEHMLLVCGRWTGPSPAAHDDFCLGRLLRVDGLHRLFLKHWPVTCGFVCRQQGTQQQTSRVSRTNRKYQGVKTQDLSGSSRPLPSKTRQESVQVWGK